MKVYCDKPHPMLSLLFPNSAKSSFSMLPSTGNEHRLLSKNYSVYSKNPFPFTQEQMMWKTHIWKTCLHVFSPLHIFEPYSLSLTYTLVFSLSTRVFFLLCFLQYPNNYQKHFTGLILHPSASSLITVLLAALGVPAFPWPPVGDEGIRLPNPDWESLKSWEWSCGRQVP